MMAIVVPGAKTVLARQYVSSAVEDPANSPSLSQLYSTLLPTGIYAAIYVGLFLLLRTRFARAYAPRTFLGSLRPQEKTPELPKGVFNWIGAFFKISDEYVMSHQCLDGFLLLRYLKISVAICLFGCIVTWPVLFPVNATGHGGQIELNSISFSNISNSNGRYYAHTFVAWIFFGFVFYVVMRESIYYIHLRQAYLLSPLYAKRMSSRTVLYTSVPKTYQDEAMLRKMLGKDVKNIWIANNCKEMEELVEKRDKMAMKLEVAETKLVRMAIKARMKAVKQGNNQEAALAILADEAEGAESGSVAACWIPPHKRPTHRLKFLIGRQVDTINWCRAELERLVPEVEAMQNRFRAGHGKKQCSVFVEFNTQTEAQVAYQILAHHQPLHMSPRFIGMNPEEVIWENLNISWASRILRNIGTTAVVTTLILFWAIPVAFVGAVSNLQALSQGDPLTTPPTPPLLPFLGFINKIPNFIMGVIQGLLPSVILAVVMSVLPPFLHWMAKLAGQPSLPSVELRVQNSYFLFQVIQVFLITTITSGASASVIQIINKPTSATSLLAIDLPKASNFYISYFIVQGLGIAAQNLAQVVSLAFFIAMGKIFDSTPRKMYKRFVTLSGLGWGTEFPPYTLLTVIAITYSVIAPLVLGFATIGMYLIYLAYRYNLLFVVNAEIDTNGLVYPRALQQTTTGCYLGIICLIGLFAIKGAAGPLILMIIFLVFIIIFHWSLNSALDPLLMYLPKSLQVEEESLLALEDGHIEERRMVESKEVNVDTSDTPDSESPAASNGEGLIHKPDSLKKKPSFITKFLLPHKYTDYYTMRRLVPPDFADITYDAITERDAYYHSAIKSPTPTLWIPRDPMGVSTQECRHTSRVIPMTDEMAGFDEKGKLIWDQETAKPPIHEEKVYY